MQERSKKIIHKGQPTRIAADFSKETLKIKEGMERYIPRPERK
jgi:hypothetical protein